MAWISESYQSYRRSSDGIYRSTKPVIHRDDEYDPEQFELLRDMQSRHFWYLGRHRFLLFLVLKHLQRDLAGRDRLRAVDLGGGCGGWIDYLNRHARGIFGELALADSSPKALELAGPLLGEGVDRYQINLLQLDWREQWDVAFLLDVLEHVPEDGEVLRQIRGALRPGGLLFVTTPALKKFWSYNDELVHHVRRYSRQDFRRLADESDLELVDARYFMFLLSPLLLLARSRRPARELSREEANEHIRRTHRVPAAPLNMALRFVFSLETPIGAWLRFPWGTSVLGVFRKSN